MRPLLAALLLVLSSPGAAQAQEADPSGHAPPAGTDVDRSASPEAGHERQTAATRPDPGRVEYRHLVSISLTGLFSAGFAAQYEWLPGHPYFSLLGGLGVRAAAGGDYGSLTLAAGAGLRLWPFNGDPEDDERATGGLFFEGRLDFAWTRVGYDAQDRTVGHTLALAERVSVGYRFVFFERIELTPSAGLGLRHEFDPEGRLAPWTSPVAGVNLTAGVLF